MSVAIFHRPEHNLHSPSDGTHSPSPSIKVLTIQSHEYNLNLNQMNMGKRVLPCLILVFLLSGNLHAQKDFSIYGYSSLYFEKVGPWSYDKGGKGDPVEFDYAHFNLMMQSQISDKVKAYVNIAGVAAPEVRNYWGEYIVSDKLKIRTGKIYRTFGVYNELLDAVPTYIGTEPPEHLDGDHLLLPRFCKLMVHGGTVTKLGFLKYAYMLDSDEKMLGTTSDGKIDLSHSYDINLSMMDDKLLIGTSGFFTNERNGSSRVLGEGSPLTGMLPWMATDKYNAFTGYIKYYLGNFLIDAAYSWANHTAVRDTGLVMTVYNNTSLNANQMKNFFGNSTVYNGSNVVTKADYLVSTYYIRLSYTIPKETLKFSELTPYATLDNYSNPETIAKKTWGGDNEAGLSDDGVFNKTTFGIRLKPVSSMAIKAEIATHFQKVNGSNASYNEYHFDISYMF